MKFAFSTVACPEWNLEETFLKAKEFGYDAVELRTLGPGSRGIASDPMLTQTEKLADILQKAREETDIEIISLSTSISLHHKKRGPAHQAKFETLEALDLAEKVGIPCVRVFGYEAPVNESRRFTIQRMAGVAHELADRAANHNVQLLFENAGSFSIAKEWWWLLDMVEHPFLGMCWNIANSVAADPTDVGGWVSVPMLNSRIKIAKVKDTVIGEGTGYCKLGEGSVEIKDFLKRLLGVGFDGFVSVEWDRVWLPALAPAEEYLPESLATLKAWLAEFEEIVEKGQTARKKNDDKVKKGIDKAMAAANAKMAV